jgi:hypothetical protein
MFFHLSQNNCEADPFDSRFDSQKANQAQNQKTVRAEPVEA